MSDAGCPPFLDVAGNLFCIVLSIAMVIVLLPLLMAGILPAWALFVAFCAVIVWGWVNLGRSLFPSRWRRCSGSQLVKRMVEIEEVEM